MPEILLHEAAEYILCESGNNIILETDEPNPLELNSTVFGANTGVKIFNT